MKVFTEAFIESVYWMDLEEKQTFAGCTPEATKINVCLSFILFYTSQDALGDEIIGIRLQKLSRKDLAKINRFAE